MKTLNVSAFGDRTAFLCGAQYPAGHIVNQRPFAVFVICAEPWKHIKCPSF